MVAGLVVAADVGGAALGVDEFFSDGLFVIGESFGEGLELSGEVGVVALGGEGLSPVEAEVEVAAAIVDATNFTSRRLVLEEILGSCVVEGGTEDFGLGVASLFSEVV